MVDFLSIADAHGTEPYLTRERQRVKIGADRSRPMQSLAKLLPTSRPLSSKSDAQLIARLRQSLSAADGAAGAHCIHELWMRGTLGLQIDAMLESLWQACGASVPEWLPMRHVGWLSTAYEVAQRFQAKRRGRSNIYLILLDYSDRRSDSLGVYVGMSAYAPLQRFDQHKAGIRAAGSVLKRGIEPLIGPTLHLQRIARSEAKRIESSLAAALGDAGIHVEGGH